MLDEPKVSDQQIKEILEANQNFSENMASLASVKNQHKLSKAKLSEEFKAMIQYIHEFAGLTDLKKAEEYLEYMIKSTNVHQIASRVKKTQIDEDELEKQKYEENKTEV